MKQLVKLWQRPSWDGRSFTYYLIYIDENNKRKQKSLGHANKRKAEQQMASLERELHMGVVEPCSMKLSSFIANCIERTRGQVRENTISEYDSTMRQFIETAGNIDVKKIQHKHGELFIQSCLDSGNRPATVRKKIGTLKRIFQLAIERGQLDENPFRFVRKPKSPSKAIRIFSEQECRMLLKTAQDTKIGAAFRWDIVFLLALTTAMRRGEILNTTWRDVDFENGQINVTPKKDSNFTWQWEIKDNERRRLPLTEEVIKLLTEHHSQQPEGFPYVFVLPQRYEYIQKQIKQGKWNQRKASCPANNFRRQFQLILSHAGIEDGEFHDLRRTCLTNWFRNGLSEYDVMTMAGHSSFETTRKFYLAVRNDLIEKTKAASSKALSNMSVANLLQ